MSTDEAGACLGPLVLPDAVVATSPVRGPWGAATRRNPVDAFWLALTADPSLVRTGHRAVIAFAAPVSPGRTLAHPKFRGIATAKRVLCVRALSPNPGRGPMAASVVSGSGSRFDWFARWFADQRAPSLAALGPPDYLDFLRRLRAGGALGLVDLDGRLSAVDPADLAALVPIGPDGFARWEQADAGAFALLAGVTPVAASQPAFRAAVASILGLDAPAVACGQASAALIRSHLDNWRYLRDASRAGALPDPLAFDPFGTVAPRSAAARLGRPGGRTPTIAPQDFLSLLQSATRVVLVEGPSVIAAVRDAARIGVPGAPALAGRVQLLMAACAALLGGMLARRRGEVIAMRAGRVKQPPAGPATIGFWIEKSLRRLDDVASPPLAVEAMRTLEGLAAAGGGGDGWLFRVDVGGRVVSFDPDEDMRALAALAGYGAQRQLAFHQLRRANAILMCHGYSLGSVDMVARQLRHGDDASSAIYLTEADTGALADLADAVRAGRARMVAGLGSPERAALGGDLARLRRGREGGGPADRALAEGSALLLLEDWAASGAAGDRGCARRIAPVVRVGSCAGRAPTDARPLLDMVLEGAGALLAAGWSA